MFIIMENMKEVRLGGLNHLVSISAMTDNPRMANLSIDGIMKDDVTTESHQIFWQPHLRNISKGDQSAW